MPTLEDAVAAMTRICGPGTVTEQYAHCSFTNTIVRLFAVIATKDHLIITDLSLHPPYRDSGYRAAIIEMSLTFCRLDGHRPLVVNSLAEEDPSFWTVRGFSPSELQTEYWEAIPWHWSKQSTLIT